MSIVVVGSIAFDSIKTPFGECEQVLGGAANYFSLAASFFTRVNLVGVVGEDFPESHLSYLKERSIDVTGVKRQYGKTFHWQGSYGYDLNEARTLKTELNVFADFSPELPEHYRNAETVFLANIDPTLQLKVLDQIKNPKVVALDTMNFWIEGKNAELKKAISRVDILFINEAELRQLAKEHNIVKAAKAMQAMGPSTVVVKRGEYGALLFNGEGCFFVPAYPLEDLYDPTGAGDTFAGGFLGWLDRQGEGGFERLKEAMTLGTVMASFVIEDFSFDRMRKLELQEIEARCAQLQNLSTTSKRILLQAQG
jgi:sugar/nucleoside kinase (ribokinase family)